MVGKTLSSNLSTDKSKKREREYNSSNSRFLQLGTSGSTCNTPEAQIRRFLAGSQPEETVSRHTLSGKYSTQNRADVVAQGRVSA
jgi:hypothetical protein